MTKHHVLRPDEDLATTAEGAHFKARACVLQAARGDTLVVYRQVYVRDVLGICAHYEPGALILDVNGEPGAKGAQGVYRAVTDADVCLLASLLPMIGGPQLPRALPKYLYAFFAHWCVVEGLAVPDVFKPEWFDLDREASRAWALQHEPAGAPQPLDTRRCQIPTCRKRFGHFGLHGE